MEVYICVTKRASILLAPCTVYGREYRMRRNRNGRNVQLEPGKQTAKTGVWFGK
jgi:hypothetical protein